MTQQKQKSDLTWLQCQIPRTEWDALNERRLKLNLKWADVIIPSVKGKLEATPADASIEAAAVTTIENKAPEKSRARKSTKAKKTPAIAEVK
jgi:hypothetical protein